MLLDLTPTTVISGSVWPTIPTGPGMLNLAMLFQLQQSEWWEPERLAEHQFAQARAMLAHTAAHLPFYRERFAAAGFDPTRDDPREHWHRIPVVTRAELQSLGRAFRAESPSDHGAITENQTSGSSGRPLLTACTELQQMIWRACLLREHFWHRRDLTGRLATIRVRGFRFGDEGKEVSQWGPPTSEVYRTGPAAMLSVLFDVETQVDWLMRQNPTYLLTHPTNVVALARHFIASGKRLPELLEVRTMGESLPDDIRDVVREAWDVPVTDMYSAEEVGYIALQCPDHHHYHVQSENLLVEIVDVDGRPCRPGEVGRVILTSLHNFASPLVRYEIMDYAEVGEPCPCGRGLPVISRIAGRQRNMVVDPEGKRRWAGFGARDYLRIAPIEQMQMVQHTPDRLEARVVMPRPMTGEEHRKFSEYIEFRFGYPFAVDVSYHDEIPRTPGGKFEEFVSYVSDPRSAT